MFGVQPISGLLVCLFTEQPHRLRCINLHWRKGGARVRKSHKYSFLVRVAAVSFGCGAALMHRHDTRYRKATLEPVWFSFGELCYLLPVEKSLLEGRQDRALRIVTRAVDDAVHELVQHHEHLPSEEEAQLLMVLECMAKHPRSVTGAPASSHRPQTREDNVAFMLGNLRP